MNLKKFLGIGILSVGTLFSLNTNALVIDLNKVVPSHILRVYSLFLEKTVEDDGYLKISTENTMKNASTPAYRGKLIIPNSFIIGTNNSSNSAMAPIGGGSYNYINSTSTGAGIGGGFKNRVEDGVNSVILGGSGNTLRGGNSVIIGGEGITIESSGIVLGGLRNEATDGGLVLGGKENTASNFGLAFGVKADADRGFVWRSAGVTGLFDNSVQIDSVKGVMIGSVNPMMGIGLSINGALKIAGNNDVVGSGGEIKVVSGCFYAFNGINWELLNQGASNCKWQQHPTCKFGNIELHYGEEVLGYSAKVANNCKEKAKKVICTGEVEGEFITVDTHESGYDSPYCYDDTKCDGVVPVHAHVITGYKEGGNRVWTGTSPAMNNSCVYACDQGYGGIECLPNPLCGQDRCAVGQGPTSDGRDRSFVCGVPNNSAIVSCWCSEGKKWNAELQYCVDNARMPKCNDGSATRTKACEIGDYEGKTYLDKKYDCILGAYKVNCSCEDGYLFWNGVCIDGNSVPSCAPQGEGCLNSVGVGVDGSTSFDCRSGTLASAKCSCPVGKVWSSTAGKCIEGPSCVAGSCNGIMAAYEGDNTKYKCTRNNITAVCSCGDGNVFVGSSCKAKPVCGDGLSRITLCTVGSGVGMGDAGYSCMNNGMTIPCSCGVGKVWSDSVSHCVDKAYTCTGILPLHASLVSTGVLYADAGYTHVSSSNSTVPCGFRCDNGYSWNANSGTCVYSCDEVLGKCTIGTGLGVQGEPSKYKCNNGTYSVSCSCPDGMIWSGGSNSCVQSSKVCRESTFPNNAIKNNSVQPSVNSDYVHDAVNLSSPCTFKCDSANSYLWNGSACVNACGGSSCNVGTISGTSGAAQFTCSVSGYTGVLCSCPSGTLFNGTQCVQSPKACSGTLPENSESNAAQPTASVVWFFTGNTSVPCGFHCQTGYTYNSNSKTCNPNSCTLNNAVYSNGTELFRCKTESVNCTGSDSKCDCDRFTCNLGTWSVGSAKGGNITGYTKSTCSTVKVDNCTGYQFKDKVNSVTGATSVQCVVHLTSVDSLSCVDDVYYGHNCTGSYVFTGGTCVDTRCTKPDGTVVVNGTIYTGFTDQLLACSVTSNSCDAVRGVFQCSNGSWIDKSGTNKNINNYKKTTCSTSTYNVCGNYHFSLNMGTTTILNVDSTSGTLCYVSASDDMRSCKTSGWKYGYKCKDGYSWDGTKCKLNGGATCKNAGQGCNDGGYASGTNGATFYKCYDKDYGEEGETCDCPSILANQTYYHSGEGICKAKENNLCPFNIYEVYACNEGGTSKNNKTITGGNSWDCVNSFDEPEQCIWCNTELNFVRNPDDGNNKCVCKDGYVLSGSECVSASVCTTPGGKKISLGSYYTGYQSAIEPCVPAGNMCEINKGVFKCTNSGWEKVSGSSPIAEYPNTGCVRADNNFCNQFDYTGTSSNANGDTNAKDFTPCYLKASDDKKSCYTAAYGYNCKDGYSYDSSQGRCVSEPTLDLNVCIGGGHNGAYVHWYGERPVDIGQLNVLIKDGDDNTMGAIYVRDDNGTNNGCTNFTGKPPFSVVMQDAMPFTSNGIQYYCYPHIYDASYIGNSAYFGNLNLSATGGYLLDIDHQSYDFQSNEISKITDNYSKYIFVSCSAY